MKWPIYSICVLCILALAGVALGAEKMENKAASEAKSKTFIFIQEGSSGSFVNDSAGNYTLTMNDVVPYTVFFADRPARDVGFVPMDKFLKVSDFGVNNPPNAAIILPDENETSDMVVVELTKPQYNNTTRTLTYKAKQLKNYSFKSGWLQDHASEVDPAIPESFGRVSIVIDNMAGRHCLDSTVSCWNKDATKSCGGDIPTGCCWNWAYLQCTACHDLSSECIAQFGNNCPTPQDSCNGWSNPKKG